MKQVSEADLNAMERRKAEPDKITADNAELISQDGAHCQPPSSEISLHLRVMFAPLTSLRKAQPRGGRKRMGGRARS